MQNAPCEIISEDELESDEDISFSHLAAETDDSDNESVNKSEIINTTHTTRIELPIDSHRDFIMKSIQENRVTIIQGETGCGKSSRVPVFILEDPPPEPTHKHVKIFICQPRRIAAKSLCDRIRDTEPDLKKYVALRM